MPEFRSPVDAEAIIVEHLTNTLDDDVATVVPSTWKAGDRFVRVFRIGGTESGEGAGHVDRANLQLETFGDGDVDAANLYAEMVLALRLAPSAFFDGAAVTSIDKSFGPAFNPDNETGAARYLSGWIVTVHPTATGS